MKKNHFLIVLFFALGFTTMSAQEKKNEQNRQPAYNVSSNNGGGTTTTQPAQDKSVMQTAVEGTIRTLDRYEPGSTAAAAGTYIYNNYVNDKKETPPAKPATTTGTATAQ